MSMSSHEKFYKRKGVIGIFLVILPSCNILADDQI